MRIVKQCKSCLKEFSAKDKSCPECGAINSIERTDNMKIVKKCKKCSKEFSINDSFCPECGAINSIYKIAAGLWLIVFILGYILVVGAAGGSDSGNVEPIQEISQSISENTIAENKSEDKVSIEDKVEDNVPAEYKSALKEAKFYSEIMGMSKAGIYRQLTFEYGDNFSVEAAQYAVDNLEVDWKENALKKAKGYQEIMTTWTPQEIYEQLISEDCDQFTPEEAQYAIDNLE